MNDIVTNFFSIYTTSPQTVTELFQWLMLVMIELFLCVSVFKCIFYMITQIITKLVSKR